MKRKLETERLLRAALTTLENSYDLGTSVYTALDYAQRAISELTVAKEEYEKSTSSVQPQDRIENLEAALEEIAGGTCSLELEAGLVTCITTTAYGDDVDFCDRCIAYSALYY